MHPPAITSIFSTYMCFDATPRKRTALPCSGATRLGSPPLSSRASVSKAWV